MSQPATSWVPARPDTSRGWSDAEVTFTADGSTRTAPVPDALTPSLPSTCFFDPKQVADLAAKRAAASEVVAS